MTTPTNNRLSKMIFLPAIAAVLALSACNDSADSKATPGNMDTTAAKADTSAMKPVAKMKKGKASAMMTMDNKEKMMKDKDGVYNKAETMPEYPGGDAAVSKYVEDNINYPQDAIDNNKEGTVKVSFIIDEKGKVEKPMVTGSSMNNSLDNEATRIVGNMSGWKPGMVKGKAVKTRMQIPITFKLAES